MTRRVSTPPSSSRSGASRPASPASAPGSTRPGGPTCCGRWRRTSWPPPERCRWRWCRTPARCEPGPSPSGCTVLDDPGTLDLAAAAGLGWAGAVGLRPGRGGPCRPAAGHEPRAGCRRRRPAGGDRRPLPPRRRHAGPVAADGRRRFRLRLRAGIVPPPRRRRPRRRPGLPGAARRPAGARRGRPRGPRRAAPPVGRRAARPCSAHERAPAGAPERPVASYLAPPRRGRRQSTCPFPAGRWPSAPIPTTSTSAAAARWPSGRRPGCAVTELVLTDGSKGSWDPTVDRAALVAAPPGGAASRRRRARVPATSCSSATSTASSPAGWPSGPRSAG